MTTITNAQFVIYERADDAVLHRVGCPVIRGREVEPLNEYGLWTKICGRCKPDIEEAQVIADRVTAENQARHEKDKAERAAARERDRVLFAPLMTELREEWPDASYYAQEYVSSNPEDAFITLSADDTRAFGRLRAYVEREKDVWSLHSIDHSGDLIKSVADAQRVLTFLTKVKDYVDLMNQMEY